MRHYEKEGYEGDDESVEDLIVRTVQAHVIYGEDGDIFGQLKELRYNLKTIEWSNGSCPACYEFDNDGHADDCWLEKELKS